MPSTRAAAATTTRAPSRTPRASSEWAAPRSAARDDVQGRFGPGDAVGMGGELVAWGDPAATLATILEGALLGGRRARDLPAGANPLLGRDDVEVRMLDGVELEYHEGGQPAWWWLLAAEKPNGARRGAGDDLRTMPTRFAATDALTAEDLRGAELLPRPSRYRGAGRAAGQQGKALAGLGIETVGDLIKHLPHAHRDRRDVTRRRVGRGGGGDRRRNGPQRDRQADARPAPQARRGARLRRERPARGRLVQPALIARQPGEGAAVLLHGKPRRRGEFSG